MCHRTINIKKMLVIAKYIPVVIPKNPHWVSTTDLWTLTYVSTQQSNSCQINMFQFWREVFEFNVKLLFFFYMFSSTENVYETMRPWQSKVFEDGMLFRAEEEKRYSKRPKHLYSTVTYCLCVCNVDRPGNTKQTKEYKYYKRKVQ